VIVEIGHGVRRHAGMHAGRRTTTPVSATRDRPGR
jgi:hypothetical protein